MNRTPLLHRLALSLLPRAFRDKHASDLTAGLEVELSSRTGFLGRAWAHFRWLMDVLGVALSLHLRRRTPPSSGRSWTTSLSVLTRQAIRGLRSEPVVTILAILMVGVGVGASATVFSVANTLLVRPLPFSEPDRLLFIGNGDWGRGQQLSSISVQVGHLQNILAESETLTDVGGFHLFDWPSAHALTRPDRDPIRLTRIRVTPNLFPILGVQPYLGRSFSEAESVQDGPPVLLLTWDGWMRLYGGDPSVVGASAIIDDEPIPIAGVLPQSFDYPSIFSPGSRIDFVVPWAISTENSRSGNTLALIGRLASGATPDAALAELQAIAERHAEDALNSFRPRVTPLREHVSGSFRGSTLLLGAAVLLVMLMVCANLSNLLLSRGTGRRRELAVKAALGAAPRTLLGQLLAEGTLLALTGGALGVVVASAATAFIASSVTQIPLLEGVDVDRAVLAFALLASILTGLVFSTLPALRASHTPPADVLRSGGRGASAARKDARLREGLVIAQISLASLLLISTVLLLRSFRELSTVDLGFEPQQTVTARIDPNRRFSTDEEEIAYYDGFLRAASSTDAVTAAALVDVLPVEFNRRWDARNQPPTADDVEDAESVSPYVRIISPGYLQAMGLTLLSGRDLLPSDDGASPRVALVNDRLAQVLWPGQDPIGERLWSSGGEYTVIGVTKGMRHLAPDQPPGPEVFFAQRQLAGQYGSLNLIARGNVDGPMAANLRESIQRVDPGLALDPVRTVQGLLDSALSPRRFLLSLIGAFAATALALASLGIYGVLTYSVNQRRRELGIRLALGQARASLLLDILGSTLRLAAVGSVLGLVAALAFGRFLEGHLYGVSQRDPWTIVSVVGLMALVALAAAYVPAHRASRVDALRVLTGDS